MNREERRRMMKKNPAYRHAIKTAAKKSVEDLEEMFRKKWQEDDETLNNGEIYGRPDYGEDDILNS